MSSRVFFPVSLLLAWSFALALSIAALFRLTDINLGDLSSAVMGISFSSIGALISIRSQAGRPIGLLFLGIGLSLALNAFGFAYAPLFQRQGLVSAANFAAWVGTWSWQPGFFLLVPCLLVLFPDGRPASKGGRQTLVLCAAGLLLSFVGTIFNSGNLPEMPGYANPVGIEAITPNLDLCMVVGAALWLVIGLVGGPWALVTRFRSSSGVARQQLKWFVWAGLATVATYIIWSAGFNTFGWQVAGLIALLGTPLLPVGAAIAILRYRLYDIDVIINRTLVYGVLTAALLASYLLIVVTLSRVLDPVTQDSDIAVAASTLAVAALFGPLRRRIQGFIDRRFYRAKYDSARALNAFASRLRDEIEVDVVSSDVLGVVNSTLQPQHASVWLRPS